VRWRIVCRCVWCPCGLAVCLPLVRCQLALAVFLPLACCMGIGGLSTALYVLPLAWPCVACVVAFRAVFLFDSLLSMSLAQAFPWAKRSLRAPGMDVQSRRNRPRLRRGTLTPVQRGQLLDPAVVRIVVQWAISGEICNLPATPGLLGISSSAVFWSFVASMQTTAQLTSMSRVVRLEFRQWFVHLRIATAVRWNTNIDYRRMVRLPFARSDIAIAPGDSDESD